MTQQFYVAGVWQCRIKLIRTASSKNGGLMEATRNMYRNDTETKEKYKRMSVHKYEMESCPDPIAQT